MTGIQIPIDIDELRRMYVDERRSVFQIAQHFHVTMATIRKRLAAHKIHRVKYVSTVPGHTTCPTCGKSTMTFARRPHQGRKK